MVYSQLPLTLVVVTLVTLLYTYFSVPSKHGFPIDYANYRDFVQSMKPENASALFNTVHSLLKQRDSDLVPNGVSFVPAIIPKGTVMFHSTSETEIPSSFEWLAMDAEFSFSFGNVFGKHPLSDKNNSANTYLYTFQATKDINRLILLDGASAAKSDDGRMDTQQLLAGLPTDAKPNERFSSKLICEWGKKFGLDGIVRVEIGFEVVLCDFFDKVELIGNNTFVDDEDMVPIDDIQFFHEIGSMRSFDWISAGARHDTGENKIHIDYKHMVSLINRVQLNTDPYLRRINNLSEEVRDQVVKELETSLVAGYNYEGTNWQLVTTEIVQKFSPMLAVINSTYAGYLDGNLTFEEFGRNLTLWSINLIRRFTDRETLIFDHDSCVFQYAHPYSPITTLNELAIWSSIVLVTDDIVKTIHDTYLLGRKIVLGHADDSNVMYHHKMLHRLLERLQWTAFYTCDTKCQWDEICYTPSWGPSPFGWTSPSSKEQFGMHLEKGTWKIDASGQCISYRTIMEKSKLRH